MSEDDPRHGTNAGYVAGCHKRECCGPAKLRYDKARKYERHSTGLRRVVPSIGYRRRVLALNAIGWSFRELAARLGIANGTLANRVYRAEWVSRVNLAKLDALYREMCMTANRGPDATRTLRNAERKGYAPPLAWDDIDDPDETPSTGWHDRTIVDEVKVQRVLNGGSETCNKAEKVEVIRRWEADKRSLNELSKVTGWNVQRERKRSAETVDTQSNKCAETGRIEASSEGAQTPLRGLIHSLDSTKEGLDVKSTQSNASPARESAVA